MRKEKESFDIAKNHLKYCLQSAKKIITLLFMANFQFWEFLVPWRQRMEWGIKLLSAEFRNELICFPKLDILVVKLIIGACFYGICVFHDSSSLVSREACQNLYDMCLYYKDFKASKPYIFVFKQFFARPIECSDVS